MSLVLSVPIVSDAAAWNINSNANRSAESQVRDTDTHMHTRTCTHVHVHIHTSEAHDLYWQSKHVQSEPPVMSTQETSSGACRLFWQDKSMFTLNTQSLAWTSTFHIILIHVHHSAANRNPDDSDSVWSSRLQQQKENTQNIKRVFVIYWSMNVFHLRLLCIEDIVLRRHARRCKGCKDKSSKLSNIQFDLFRVILGNVGYYQGGSESILYFT